MTRRLGWLAVSSLMAVGGWSCAASATTSRAPEPPARTSAGTAISVKPRSGAPKTHFLITFRAPDATGAVGSQRRSYSVSAALRKPFYGCVSSITVTAAPAAKGARVRVKLDPSTQGGKWCHGRFGGKVTELSRPVCPPGQVCPALIALLKTVGTFSFRIGSGR